MRVLGAAAFGLGLIALVTLLAMSPDVQRWSGVTRLFEHYAQLTLSGHLGKTAFLSWYPPFALGPLGLPLLGGTGPAYVLGLAAEMGAVAAGGLVLLGRFGHRLGAASRATFTYALMTLALAITVAWGYDIVPAVVGLAAAVALASGLWLVAGVALGVAAGLKVYAVVLIPIFIVWAWRTGGAEAVLRVSFGVAVAGLLAIGAYLPFPGASPAELLAFTASRPLQVESLPGAAIALLSSLSSGTVSLTFEAGAFNVNAPAAGPAIDALRLVQPILLVAVMMLSAAAMMRGRSAVLRTLVIGCLAVLLTLVVTNRVISPQYLIWLIPFAALVGGWVRGWVLASVLITAVVFPWLYSSLVQGEPLPLLLIVVRNGLLLVAWATAIWALGRGLGACAAIDRPAPAAEKG